MNLFMIKFTLKTKPFPSIPKSLDLIALRLIEEKYNLKFSSEHIALLENYGGARIEEKSFKEKHFIHFFLALPDIEKALDYYRSEEFYYEGEWFSGENWLPFADAGGWIFCISLFPNTSGQIYIDKMDAGDLEEHSFYWLANSLEEFLSALKVPED